MIHDYTPTPAEERWVNLAESAEELFLPPVIAPQGNDGVPHFNYYDKERALSFQWDGDMRQHVTVSHGGYGEPARWSFDPVVAWSHRAIVPYRAPSSMREAAQQFGVLCDSFILMMEENYRG